MYRRHFVAGLGTAGVGLSVAAPAASQSTTTLRIGSAFGTGGTARAIAAADLAARVAALSGGTIQLELSDVSGQTDGLHDALTGGSLDGVIGSADLWTSLSPAFGLFSSTPGGMMERELEAWIRSDRGQQQWDALAAAHGMKPFLLGDSGAEFLWSTPALDDAATLSGLNVIARGLAAQVWTAAGATVSAPASGQVFGGGADAWETAPLAEQYTPGGSAPAHLYLDTPTRPSSALSLNLSLAAWEGLSPEAQRVIDASATAITHRTNARSMQANALASQVLRLSTGVTVAPLPQPVWTALMEASREVFDGMESLEGEARAAWRAYTRFARDVQNWTRLSEAAFTTSRARNIPG